MFKRKNLIRVLADELKEINKTLSSISKIKEEMLYDSLAKISELGRDNLKLKKENENSALDNIRLISKCDELQKDKLLLKNKLAVANKKIKDITPKEEVKKRKTKKQEA